MGEGSGHVKCITSRPALSYETLHACSLPSFLADAKVDLGSTR